LYAVKQLGVRPSGWRGPTAHLFVDESYLAVADHLNTHRQPGDRLATGEAGAIVYLTGLPTIDCFGLTDAHLARCPASATRKSIRITSSSPPTWLVIGGVAGRTMRRPRTSPTAARCWRIRRSRKPTDRSAPRLVFGASTPTCGRRGRIIRPDYLFPLKHPSYYRFFAEIGCLSLKKTIEYSTAIRFSSGLGSARGIGVYDDADQALGVCGLCSSCHGRAVAGAAMGANGRR
jgi:hypothetical protein